MRSITMDYQRIILEAPALTDEAAASLHKFIEALMYAVDEQYYRQIHRYYAGKLNNMISDAQFIHDDQVDPPF